MSSENPGICAGLLAHEVFGEPRGARVWDDLSMLHHVAFEVSPGSMAAEGEFWLAVGFKRASAPSTLGEGFDWYEREGTQVHLMATDDPAAPPARGHTAVISPEIEATVTLLESNGTEVIESRQLWGERRVKAVTPAGHLVEIMAAPPSPGSGS